MVNTSKSNIRAISIAAGREMLLPSADIPEKLSDRLRKFIREYITAATHPAMIIGVKSLLCRVSINQRKILISDDKKAARKKYADGISRTSFAAISSPFRPQR